MRVLYIQPSPVPPPADHALARCGLVSRRQQREDIPPIWYSEAEQVEKAFGPGSWPRYKRDRFQYRWILASGYQGRSLRVLWFYVTEARRAHREQPIECVIAYAHLATAFCGIAIKFLTGARLVVEVVTSPDRVFLNDRPRPTLGDRLQRLYSDVCLHISMWACDCAHLLYPQQLDSYPLLRKVRRTVFHDWVPISSIPRQEDNGPVYIALVGAPWYLKGVDVLVAAFRRLAPDFPAAGLKIVGHFPDRANLEALTGGDKRIEILAALPYKETLRIIGQAAVFVLPSRCEGMGRVLLEAMAAGVPVVGSDVGGIPSLIRDGENGFLFPVGNVDALEARLRQLLSDPALRTKMGECGYRRAQTEFSEQVYSERFIEMVERAAGRPTP